MKVVDQYDRGLNSFLVGYEKYLRKHIPFNERLNYMHCLFNIVNEKETFPYSQYAVKITYKDKEKRKHIFQSYINATESDKTFADAFDVNYTYNDKSGQKCEINFCDLLQKEMKTLYDLFNMKTKDFEECYRSIQERNKRSVTDPWNLYGGGTAGEPDIEVEICSFYIGDEFENIIVSENGDHLVFEIPEELRGGQYVVFNLSDYCFGFIVTENDEYVVFE